MLNLWTYVEHFDLETGEIKLWTTGAALKAAGDWEGLQKLPPNSAAVRMHNRCQITGRPRGYMRQFGISRVLFRKMALAGKIPGVKKASW